MWNTHRQLDQIAGAGRGLLPVEQQFEVTFREIEELILGRMDMRRHESAGRKGGMPGEGTIRKMLWHIGLAENVPADVVDALSGRRHAWQKLVHHTLPFLIV